MSKIVRLSVANIMRIKAAAVEPDGSLVVIGGKNANGKTSLLDSITMALGGLRKKAKKPVRDGAETGEIVLELDDLVVTRTFASNGKSALRVTAKDGAEYASPQTLLDRLYSGLTFDPLAFARMDPHAQAEQLRELAGLDFTEHDAERDRVYQERRDINRDAKAAGARLEGLPVYEDAPEVVVSIAALTEQLDAATSANNERQEIINANAELDRLTTEAETAAREAREEVKRCEAALKKSKEKLGEANDAVVEAQTAERAEVPDKIETAPITEKINAAEEINEKVRANEKRANVKFEYEKLVENSDNLTIKIANLDAAKAKAIREAKYPVDGLGIDDDGVTFNAIPLEQASQAEKIRVSVAMGLALNPKLRVLLIRDASLLDDDNLAMVAKLAEEFDAQVWLERVSEGEECTVVLEDGQVREKVAS